MQRTNSRARLGAKDVRRSGRVRPMARSIAIAALCVLGVALAPALAVAAVPAAPTPLNTSAPTLTGTPRLGQKLSCSTGAWSNNPTGYSYAWLRDGTPIAGQSASTYVVQNADQGHSISCQVTASNRGGEYTITGLPSGSYKVSFSSIPESDADYLLQYYSNQPSWSSGNPVSVSAPNATGNIDAVMQLGGEIGGRVTAAAGGAPLAGITVCAALGETFQRCTATNSAGEYAMVALPSGSYTVSFVSNNLFGEGGDYASQSQGGVTVTAPNKTTGVDAQLQPGGHITGKVTSSGTPIAGVVVCAYGESFDCVFTGAGGEYSLVGLSGAYRVAFLPGAESLFGGASNGNYLVQYYNGKRSLAEAGVVTVAAPGVVGGINAELQTGGQIAGTVSDASTHKAVEQVEVCASSSVGSGCASTGATGEYTISGLATSSSYTVEFRPPQGRGYAPQSLQEVPVSVPNKTGNVNVALRPGGRISGVVTDASIHAPLEKVEVCASSKIGSGCASTSATGEYTISELATGTYTVEFIPSEGGSDAPQSLTGVSVEAPNAMSNVDAALSRGAQIAGRVTTDAAGGAGLADIEVCATEVGKEFSKCATTNGPGGSASATSNAFAIPPRSAFKLAKKFRFNAKTGNLEFFFIEPNGGTFKWGLFFGNSDTGFAASLGVLFPGRAFSAEGEAVAEAARHGKGHSKGPCTKGYVRHGDSCVPKLIPFSRGSRTVPAGTVDVKVHASAKALKALRTGHTLHVSGTFTFQSSLGGYPVTQKEKVVVRPAKKKGKRHHKKHRRK